MSLLLQLIYAALVFIPATSSAARAVVSKVSAKVPLHRLLKMLFLACCLPRLHTICTPKFWNGDNADGLGGCTTPVGCTYLFHAGQSLQASQSFGRLFSFGINDLRHFPFACGSLILKNGDLVCYLFLPVLNLYLSIGQISDFLQIVSREAHCTNTLEI